MIKCALVVRGGGIGHSQIFLTTPTNGMLGMWLIGNSLYDVIKAWSRKRDYRPQSKESPWRKKKETTPNGKVYKKVFFNEIQQQKNVHDKSSMFLVSQQLVNGRFGKP